MCKNGESWPRMDIFKTYAVVILEIGTFMKKCLFIQESLGNLPKIIK